MPAQKWEYAFQPEFKFDISDTSSAYRLYFLFRHNNAYAFNVTGPGETGTVTIQVDVGQWVVWRYQTAVTNIGNLRIRGP
jgi:hypothetical protein